MACPGCGCKETYCYEGDDMAGGDEQLERCAACGRVFDIEDHAEEDDDDMPEPLRLLDALTDRPSARGEVVIAKCVRLPPNGVKT